MDMLSMLMNARIKDMDGDDIGEVFGVHIVGGKLYVTMDTGFENEEEEDPDGGEEIDEGERELDNTEEVPKPLPLRVMAGGRQ